MNGVGSLKVRPICLQFPKMGQRGAEQQTLARGRSLPSVVTFADRQTETEGDTASKG